MNAITTRIVATTLLLFAVQSGRAEEPTNLAPAALKKHIMIAPEEIEWGECPPFLPPGAKCTTIEGDPQASHALFTIRSKLPDNYKIPPLSSNG
jgi:hypothetical protein